MTETTRQADDDYDDSPDLDLGTCPYYAHYRGGPFGTCSFGCREEPECVTCEPEEGWPGYPRDSVETVPDPEVARIQRNMDLLCGLPDDPFAGTAEAGQ